MKRLFKLVLLRHVEEHEAQGWAVATGALTTLGGREWASVYMCREVAGEEERRE